MSRVDRSAVVQRRRKPCADFSAKAHWHDWRTFESEGVALAAVVFDRGLLPAYEYRLKPDAFATRAMFSNVQVRGTHGACV